MSRPSLRLHRHAPPAPELPAGATLAVVAGRIVEVVSVGTTHAAVRPLDRAEPLFVPAPALTPCPGGAPVPDNAAGRTTFRAPD